MTDTDQELGEYIPLRYHTQMLMDKERMTSFRDAIAAAVPEGGKVLELGGGAGVLSHFAARKAAKVWCVERLPRVAHKARELLKQNPTPGEIEIVEADAMEYLPPEPVDAVICEMLHSGLLVERQAAMIESFKARYIERFGNRLPLFIPEGTVLGIQPVQQNFDFFGFSAPLPLFEHTHIAEFAPVPLGPPVLYAVIQYAMPFPEKLSYDSLVAIDRPGLFNALRFITNSALAIDVTTKTSINWANTNLTFPMPFSKQVEPGAHEKIRFEYAPGDSVEAFAETLLAME